MSARSTRAAAGAEQRLLAAARSVRGVRREGDKEMPLGERASRTRSHLLRAAYDVFSERGYQATTVGDIAERAEVGVGTYYQYFRDKGEVLAAIVGTAVADLLEGRQRRWDPARGRLGLRRVIAGFVETYVATAPFQAVWEEVTHIDPRMAALRADLSRLFTDAVEQSLAEGATDGLVRDDIEPAAMARALTAMVDRYCFTTYVAEPGDGPPVDDTIDLLTALWADAIGLVEPRAGRR